jgi:hypothetical protein
LPRAETARICHQFLVLLVRIELTTSPLQGCGEAEQHIENKRFLSYWIPRFPKFLQTVTWRSRKYIILRFGRCSVLDGGWLNALILPRPCVGMARVKAGGKQTL